MAKNIIGIDFRKLSAAQYTLYGIHGFLGLRGRKAALGKGMINTEHTVP